MGHCQAVDIPFLLDRQHVQQSPLPSSRMGVLVDAMHLFDSDQLRYVLDSMLLELLCLPEDAVGKREERTVDKVVGIKN